MTLETAATALEVSAATLSRIENGVRVPRARDVRDLCRLYGVDDERIARLTSLVSQAKETGWWESYSEVDDTYATSIGLEEAASSIQEFQSTILPALLQVPEYGMAYIRDAFAPTLVLPLSGRDIERRWEIRRRRQDRLRPERGLEYDVILDESALRRPTGGPRVMRRQIAHLMKLTEQPNITIRLLPYDRGAHPGMEGGFAILALPQEAVADVVHIDSFAGQLFLESPEELERFRRAFSVLAGVALDPQESNDAMARIADSFSDGAHD
jgi:transcriptional regulator with XRE-family HTH domain